MTVVRKSDVEEPLVSDHGEIIYELIGRDAEGSTERHSVAHVVLPPGKSSLPHYHPEAEESYYILAGLGEMEMGEETSRVKPGDLILIKPTQIHKITSVGEEDLEFLAICVPAWEPDNSVFIKDVS